jgi:hypothetical protein
MTQKWHPQITPIPQISIFKESSAASVFMQARALARPFMEGAGFSPAKWSP